MKGWQLAFVSNVVQTMGVDLELGRWERTSSANIARNVNRGCVTSVVCPYLNAF